MEIVFFRVVDTGGRTVGDADSLRLGPDCRVVKLRRAVIAHCRPRWIGAHSSQLRVFADEAAFQAQIPLCASASVEGLGDNGDHPLVVVVPATVQTPFTVDDINCYGDLNVDLDSAQTLQRPKLANEIVRRLDRTHLLQVHSPPMTGKTVLVTLVRNALVAKYTQEERRLAAFTLELLKKPEAMAFERFFLQQCGVKWIDAVRTLPEQDFTVYVLLDEAQVIYSNKDGRRPPETSGYRPILGFVKYIQSDARSPVNFFMLTSDGWSVEYSPVFSSPIDFDKEATADITLSNFSLDEVHEYVAKSFKGIDCLMDSAPARTAFCSNLLMLTGGHVGLCVTAIRALNEVYDFHERSGIKFPEAGDWVRMLQTGDLHDDYGLFKRMTSSHAVDMFKSLTTPELNSLELLTHFSDRYFDDSIVRKCLRKGILIKTQDSTLLSPPVVWRVLLKMHVQDIGQAVCLHS